MPITKHNFIVKDVSTLADTIRKAFRIAQEGRPGPVLIDVTKDATAAECDYVKETPKPIERKTESIREEDIDTVTEMIAQAKKPFVFVGGGVVLSGASEELARFVHKINAPVADSLMGKGDLIIRIHSIQVCLACMVQRHLTMVFQNVTSLLQLVQDFRTESQVMHLSLQAMQKLFISMLMQLRLIKILKQMHV